MKYIKQLIVSSIILVTIIGCKGDLLDLNPYGEVGSGKMWSTENLADQGITAIYSALRNREVGSLYYYDCYASSTTTRDEDEAILFNKVTTNDGMFSNSWRQHYEGIHRANDAIFNLDKAPISPEKYARLIAESKFLRAYYYYKLNILFKGVPLYLEPVEPDKANNPRETEEAIWKVIEKDLTDCISEAHFPDKYKKGSGDFGRATKSAAYALRGKAYMYQKEWAKAEADFKKVGDLGHSLFQGGYKQLFKEANEQSDEMIFSVQHIGLSGYGNDISFRFGSRATFGSCWNTYLPSTDFVDSYTYANGKPFDWNELFPGWDTKDPAWRAVYFLRDGMTEKEIKSIKVVQKNKAGEEMDMSEYLPTGNEERILQAYNDRDPRLAASIITPYSDYNGAVGSTGFTYVLRWPYRGFDEAYPYDLRTDTNNRYYYLYRKFVAEGPSEISNRSYSPIDFPLIRYADVVLNLAEVLNEQDKVDEAVTYVNMVRERAGVALLNSNEYTKVNGQDDLRERIRDERRWEFNGEGVTFFDELRWKTWEETKFFEGAGLKQIWGQNQYRYTWSGDRVYHWPIPRVAIERNSNLKQSPGWID